MNDHLISVIIPVYNTAEYLPRCLDSVLSSTYRDLEVICINDGSQDNSLEVLYSYASKDSRIRIIDQKNAGVSAARNRGLDEATGEYIAFVDSDDWVHRQFFEVLFRLALQTDADIVTCDAQYVSSKVEDRPIMPNETQYSMITPEQMIAGEMPVWGKLYKKRTLGAIRFIEGAKLGEDILFNAEILYALTQPRLCCCCHMLYYYYSREDSAVHTEQQKNLETLVKWYLSHLHRAPSEEIRAISLEKTVKRLLSWRYSVMFSADKEEKTILSELCCLSKQALKDTPVRSRYHNVILLIMLQFPSIYRLCRILNDPTLLKREKLQREKMRAEKKK